jgi:lysophospholipase L1-like esterase
VAQTLNLKLSPATCSGAVTSDLYSKQTLSNSQTIPAQLDTAFANGTPQLITITVGANDIHWSSYVGKCLVSTCGTWSDTAVATISRVEMQAKLAYVFYQIGQRSHGTPPRVVVTGYYNPVSPACTAVMPQLTANEISWLTSQEQSLNRAIKNTSSLFSFVTFAPVDFTGHDICSTSSWVQSPSGAAPLHPTAAGQAVIAKSVLNTLGQ